MRVLNEAPVYAELKPEAQAGFILGFVIVGFFLAVLAAYCVYITSIIKDLKHRVGELEVFQAVVEKEKENPVEKE